MLQTIHGDKITDKNILIQQNLVTFMEIIFEELKNTIPGAYKGYRTLTSDSGQFELTRLENDLCLIIPRDPWDFFEKAYEMDKETYRRRRDEPGLYSANAFIVFLLYHILGPFLSAQTNCALIANMTAVEWKTLEDELKTVEIEPQSCSSYI